MTIALYDASHIKKIMTWKSIAYVSQAEYNGFPKLSYPKLKICHFTALGSVSKNKAEF